jgi:hypothetical protein
MSQDAAGLRLSRQEHVLAGHIPDTLQQLVEQQIARLSPAEQQLLEAASISGRVFSAAAVAAGKVKSQRSKVKKKIAISTPYSRKDEAQQLLTQVYDWFTEGFETTNLKAAHALLAEIRSPSGSLSPCGRGLG